MSTSISSLYLAAQSTANTTAAAAPAARPQPVANAGGDTVQLTEAQQVYQLYNQGQRVSQIAANLSLTQAAVNSYLNLSATG
jgi:DNA-binding NarL/FixJ family response regulator